MAVIDKPLADMRASGRVQRNARPADSLRYDILIAVLTAWFIGGLFLDGWAHNNGRVDDTFFTPWHLVLYSGYAVVGAALVFTHFRNVMRGYAWTKALPQGYGLALAGVMLFGLGGGFDFWWHSTFGFEANTEALLSPAHLLLASGAFLFITSPLRAAWNRTGSNQGWRQLFPAILSLLYVFSLLTFFTQYSNFASSPAFMVGRISGNHFLEDVFGVWSIVVPTTLFIGTVLFALRRWRLPVGTFTLIFTVNVTIMWLMEWGRTVDFPMLLLLGPIGGIVTDALLFWLKPSASNAGALRIFAFVVPLILGLVYIVLLNMGNGPLWWPIHMWLGVPFIAGIVGLFLSFLVAPPAIPQDATA